MNNICQDPDVYNDFCYIVGGISVVIYKYLLNAYGGIFIHKYSTLLCWEDKKSMLCWTQMSEFHSSAKEMDTEVALTAKPSFLCPCDHENVSKWSFYQLRSLNEHDEKNAQLTHVI